MPGPIRPGEDAADAPITSGEFREFVVVLRQALMMIVRYLERRYML